MVDYKSSVLQNYADALYTLSYMVAFCCGIGGFVVGGFYSGFIYQVSEGPSQTDNTGAYIIIGLSTIFGLLFGLMISFNLRVKAQTILCQVAIEQNTRKQARSLNRQPIS